MNGGGCVCAPKHRMVRFKQDGTHRDNTAPSVCLGARHQHGGQVRQRALPKYRLTCGQANGDSQGDHATPVEPRGHKGKHSSIHVIGTTVLEFAFGR
jgi:hypothetical protein